MHDEQIFSGKAVDDAGSPPLIAALSVSALRVGNVTLGLSHATSLSCRSR
jgi:hypothetical protein